MAAQHEVHVTLREGMFFEGFTGESHSDRFPIPLDTDELEPEQRKGISPVRLLLVGLAGCMAMDVISIMRKKRQSISGMDVQVIAEHTDDHPKTYTHIALKFILTGHQIDPAALARSIELSYTKYCPAANLFKLTVPIETSYEIIETI
jgi:putative redox protein